VSRHSGTREASRLHSRLEALNDARELAGGVLPEESLDDVLQVLERASTRRSLSADHTVVGFFGATGSGKSSLFNAVSGADIATAAARRPTTSEPLAGVWGAAGSEPLLDWLGVDKRHHSAAVPGFADEATGLILLDLPDFDSTKAANREIVQRMVGLVDVLVWVLDPQKYADAAVHNDFLAPLASHGAVTLVVLNQIDLLPPPDIEPVLESLKALLARDGRRCPSGWRRMFPRRRLSSRQPPERGKRQEPGPAPDPASLKSWRRPPTSRSWSMPCRGPTGTNPRGAPAGP
jgi:energy-coupling factor transporter ATP-binding protein EcfA2